MVVRPAFKVVTPGIRDARTIRRRPANGQQHPSEAIAAGADFIVVGRAVTNAANPRAALEGLASVSLKHSNSRDTRGSGL
jgi:orotidine-5'-phosphate decarboxylase